MTRDHVARSAVLLAAGVLGSALVTGCGSQGNAESGNAEAAAVSFARDVGQAPADACGLLAPQTREQLEESEGPCASALSDQLVVDGNPPGRGPAESVEVYGKDAIVRLSSDTVFLARFGDGWRVTAAGCTRPQVGRPYDCKVRGS